MNQKDLGNYAELRFCLACYEKGFSILRPFSDSRPYDFVLESGGRFIRVQVKSCSTPLDVRGRFRVSIGRGTAHDKQYTSKDCDVIAVYLKSLDIFYLIPVQFIDVIKLTLYPLKETSRFFEFKNNWNL
ncbi:MAG: hypothetical protein KAI25_02090 [Hyphomicrobiaceae bacterium]|nr:hypothetical protein [Hyphomicrobiaceae bacterium]